MKNGRAISIVLIFALLAGATAYFATKSIILEGKIQKTPVEGIQASPTPTASETATTTPTATATPTPTSSAQVTAPDVAANQRLASPAETYTVVEGDTLFPVGLKLDVAWQEIAAANNLKDPYVLRIDQNLIVPTVSDGSYRVLFSTDPSRAQSYQTQVSQGQLTWRLDPVASAAAEVGGVYGLVKTDDFSLTNRDDNSGQATLTARQLSGSVVKTYEIKLRQPVTKGSAGIWAIESIVPKE